MKNSFELIIDVVRRIPRGKVATYGQIAMLAGNPRWSRVVGYALHVIPIPRISHATASSTVSASRPSAFAFGGVNEQILLLQADGVEFIDGRVDLEKYLWDGHEKGDNS